jgi:hypothetical protein
MDGQMGRKEGRIFRKVFAKSGFFDFLHAKLDFVQFADEASAEVCQH